MCLKVAVVDTLSGLLKVLVDGASLMESEMGRSLTRLRRGNIRASVVAAREGLGGEVLGLLGRLGRDDGLLGEILRRGSRQEWLLSLIPYLYDLFHEMLCLMYQKGARNYILGKFFLVYILLFRHGPEWAANIIIRTHMFLLILVISGAPWVY
jgi:hypothetical protein